MKVITTMFYKSLIVREENYKDTIFHDLSGFSFFKFHSSSVRRSIPRKLDFLSFYNYDAGIAETSQRRDRESLRLFDFPKNLVEHDSVDK